MGAARRIGLIYSYNENWIGGTYYVENIVKSLAYLSEEQQPELLVYTNVPKRYADLKSASGYSKMSCFDLSLPNNLFTRVKRKLANSIKLSFLEDRPYGKTIDYLFPNGGGFLFQKIPSRKIIYWIPDFQELRLPDYFSREEQSKRIGKHKTIAASTNKVVFSSEAALKDYKHFYPNHTTENFVIPFAVHMAASRFSQAEIETVKIKYDVNEPFCIIPNQLWKHKNHLVVMDAVALLKKKGKSVLILNSGKEEDFRFPNHPNDLKMRAADLGVQDVFKFLGFIPKRDLDILIFAADIILQPSLFEGWNTGIEEAKSQNKYILASNIDVHQEQLKNYPNSKLFKVSDAEDLAEQLEVLLDQKPSVEKYNYTNDILSFARSLCKMWS